MNHRWTTDRLPRKSEAEHNGNVYVLAHTADSSEKFVRVNWANVELGMAWASPKTFSTN